MKRLIELSLILITLMAVGCSGNKFDADKADALYEKSCEVGFTKLNQTEMIEFLAQANYAFDEAEDFAREQLKTQGKEKPYSERDMAKWVGIWRSQPEAVKPMETIKRFSLKLDTNCERFRQHTGGELYLYDYNYVVEQLYSDYSEEFKNNLRKFYNRAILYDFYRLN